MNDSEKIKMYLNIGEQRIALTVPFDRQDFVRDVESDVDGLYRKWRLAFPAKSDREILAMVAYQYAKFYAELRERKERPTMRDRPKRSLPDTEARPVCAHAGAPRPRAGMMKQRVNKHIYQQLIKTDKWI